MPAPATAAAETRLSAAPAEEEPNRVNPGLARQFPGPNEGPPAIRRAMGVMSVVAAKQLLSVSKSEAAALISGSELRSQLELEFASWSAFAAASPLERLLRTQLELASEWQMESGLGLRLAMASASASASLLALEFPQSVPQIPASQTLQLGASAQLSATSFSRQEMERVLPPPAQTSRQLFLRSRTWSANVCPLVPWSRYPQIFREPFCRCKC